LVATFDWYVRRDVGHCECLAMAHGADGIVMQVACILAGFSIPALVALAT
jgi:hypothetical protein